MNAGIRVGLVEQHKLERVGTRPPKQPPKLGVRCLPAQHLSRCKHNVRSLLRHRISCDGQGLGLDVRPAPVAVEPLTVCVAVGLPPDEVTITIIGRAREVRAEEVSATLAPSVSLVVAREICR